jgi:hypothetical protein
LCLDQVFVVLRWKAAHCVVHLCLVALKEVRNVLLMEVDLVALENCATRCPIALKTMCNVLPWYTAHCVVPSCVFLP